MVRANQLKVEIFGLIKGFNCLFNPRVPHIHLNPLYQSIPELDPTKGGTLIGSSRDYVDPEKKEELDLVVSRLKKLGIDGLICIGGDGTLNGLQPLAERLPVVLAPKTIDNDLGLNYPSEPDEWVRVNDPTAKHGFRYKRAESNAVFDLESHHQLRRRPAMPRRCSCPPAAWNASAPRRKATGASPSLRSWGGIPATSRWARPTAGRTSFWFRNIAPDLELLVERVKHLYDLQKNVVIVCGEGIVDEKGQELGAESAKPPIPPATSS